MTEEDEALVQTPLGRARAAIREAEQEVAEAYEVALKVSDLWGYSDMELIPDHSSLSFVAIFDFNDSPAEAATKVAHLLRPVLERCGIARVECRRVEVDSAYVSDVDKAALADAREPG